MGTSTIPTIQDVFSLLAQGVMATPEQLAPWAASALFYLEAFAMLGLSLSVVLLALVVYTRIRLEQVEHHGFHEKEKAEHAMHAAAAAPVAKNPRWEGVTILASSSSDSDWRRAITEADILLGDMLTARGYAGTIGEQLKSANPQQFTTLDLAWEAHRMRNALAHLGEAFPLTERDTRATIDQYRRVFEEFDYI